MASKSIMPKPSYRLGKRKAVCACKERLLIFLVHPTDEAHVFCHFESTDERLWIREERVCSL